MVLGKLPVGTGSLPTTIALPDHPRLTGGRSGGAMVLGKLTVPGRPTLRITIGQGPTVLVVGAGGGCLDIFTLIYPSLLFLPLFRRRPDID